MAIVKTHAKGQVTIPKAIRDKLGIKTGTSLHVELVEDHLEIRPLPDDPIEFLDEVLPRVVTMHASDRYLLPGTSLEEMRQADGTLGYPKNLCHGVTGKGMIDYEAVFTRLHKIDFGGWVSIEDGMNGMEEMKESVQFLRRMRRKYWGDSA